MDSKPLKIFNPSIMAESLHFILWKVDWDIAGNNAIKSLLQSILGYLVQQIYCHGMEGRYLFFFGINFNSQKILVLVVENQVFL